MGLTSTFHGKKGGPEFFFCGLKGGPRKIFAVNIFASGPPLQVFVNGPLPFVLFEKSSLHRY